MNEEEVKKIVIQAWEQWKFDSNVAPAKPSEKRTFGQWLIQKLNIKIPTDMKSMRFTFAIQFFSKNRKQFKGLSVADIENYIKQNEARSDFQKACEKMGEEVTTLLTPHLNTLLKKRQRLLIKDDYGFVDEKRWQKELDYFLDRAILPYLTTTTREGVELSTMLLRVADNPNIEGVNDNIDHSAIINNLIKIHIKYTLDLVPENTTQDVDIDLLDPTEYEHFCAGLLKENGWDVRVTQASGDQGIDILAEKDGFLLAIQCKKYTSPVGNKAVQEAHSGGTFYNANAFAVVSPMEYTPSARALANSLNVYLYHHDDLGNLTVTDKEK